jgi:hypothetical protein
MKKAFRFINLLVFSLILFSTSMKAQFPADYQGIPYRDSIYTGNKLNAFHVQNLPGRLELAYYDLGGEGVAYHDKTSKNEGEECNRQAGEVRPGIAAYVAFFREHEGVDINYTKDNQDYSSSNKIDPGISQLYLGWLEQGEWANYTVYVHKKGKYMVYADYSSVDPTPAELWINNTFAGRLTFPENTGNFHWWTQSEVGSILFPEEGRYLLTVKFGTGVAVGFLDFLFNEARQE